MQIHGFSRIQGIMALAAAAAILLTASYNAKAYADPTTTSQLTVKSQLADGTELTGYFTQLTLPDTSTSTGFTPATFELNNDETYQIGVGDYLNYFFDYWLDTGSVDRLRIVSIHDDTVLNAVYRVEDQQQPGAGDTGNEQTQEETPQNDNPSTNASEPRINRVYLQRLAEKLAVYNGDNAKVPNQSLAGYSLPGGSQVMQYNTMYELINSGLNASNAMLAVDMSGLDWSSLSEEQQCFLLIVLNMDIAIDEKGLAA
jgi:hypothetical protein